MNFDLEKSMEVLERTPAAIAALLDGLSNNWVMASEGPGTWSPFDVVGHLLYAETENWPYRLSVFFSTNGDSAFKRFDRFAQDALYKGKTLETITAAFIAARKENLTALRARNISAADLQRTAIHPDLGEVSLENLLATWTAHDLAHIVQLSRVMAKQYTDAVGPWKKNFSLLNR